MENVRVRVEYRNRDMETVSVQEYGLRDYTDMLRLDQMRLIGDVEALCETALDGLPKEEWPDDVRRLFLRIKHRLQDKAGEVGRQPDNIVDDEEEEKPLLDGQDAIIDALSEE